MYLFYIDESGEIAYNSGSKYFVFNALGINANDWKSINHKVNELKTAIFKTPDAPILEVKSNVDFDNINYLTVLRRNV